MLGYRPYIILRSGAPALLFAHLLLRTLHSQPTPTLDLFLFHAIALISSLSAYLSPLINERVARISIALAILCWTFGSLFSTWNAFFSDFFSSALSDIAYTCFYPLLLFGLFRTLTLHRKKRNEIRGEIIDTLIIGFGVSGLCAGLALKSAMTNFEGSAISVFLSIVFPVGDVILVAVTISLLALQRGNLRNFLFLLGITVFTATDIYFLWQSSITTYAFAAITDDGWLIGLIVISESMWHKGSDVEISTRFNSIAATISIACSSLVIFISALSPQYFPRFVLAIAFLTIALAFLRLAIALKDARSAAQERELARTDELTGLPNRRRFLTEIEKLHSQRGTLMILDLDGFKGVNDQFGHLVGDQLLRIIATRFLRVMPTGSLLARLGGDEFGVIIYGDQINGDESALALRATLSYPITIAAISVRAGVSIGQIFHDHNIQSISKEDLLRRADTAMYEVKRDKALTL